MNSNDFSSNISPLEMAELNQEDAKKIDTALGVILNDMPSKIAYIKFALDEVKTKLNSLKTIDLDINYSTDVENLTKNYDNFSKEVINYASCYELEIIKVINLFDRLNSLDGSLTVDNNFFNNLPFLGTMMFTLFSHLGNGNIYDDFTQFALDITGNYLDRDFNEIIGNALYNATEYIGTLKNWNVMTSNGVAAAALISVESLYDLLFVNTDPRQTQITIVNAVGDGVKLVAGNMAVQYIAIPVAKTIGGAVGNVVGVAIVVVVDIAIEYVVNPIVDEITGEAFIPMTSIPKNGGLTSLYSDHVKSIEGQTYNYGNLDRTLSLHGMSISYEHCQALVQLEPTETLLSLDDYGFSEESNHFKVLNNYIENLKSIPKDSIDFEQQVDRLTANTIADYDYASDYVKILINDFNFDPYSYAMNN